MNIYLLVFRSHLISKNVALILSRLFLMIAISLALLSGSSIASPVDKLQPDGFEVKKLNVGFDGYYKIGRSTEIQFDYQIVFLGNVQPDADFSHLQSKLSLFVGVKDPNGSYVFTPVPVESLAIEVLSSQEIKAKVEANKRIQCSAKNVRVQVKFGRPESDILFRWQLKGHAVQTEKIKVTAFDSESETLATFKFRRGLNNSVRLWGVVGNPDGFPLLEEDPSFHVIYFKNEAELPQRSLAYESLNAMLIVGDYQMSQAVDKALEEWVRMGGRLFVAVGQEVSAYQKSLLSKWNPIPVLGPKIYRSMSKIESYSNTKLGIVFNGQVEGTKLGLVEGDLLIEELHAPVLLKTPYGFGAVTCFALDVAKPPLSTWQKLPELLHKIVDGNRIVIQEKNKTEIGTLSHNGITDLKTELSAAVEYFPEVNRASSWFVLGSMLIFLVVVGPLDYYVVCHLLKKPHLTWITLPLLVLLTTTIGMMSTTYSNGTEIRLNQVEWIDIDTSTNSLRVQNWASVYSPKNQRYNIKASLLESSWLSPFYQQENRRERQIEHSGFLLNWSGVPEDIYSGMYRTGGTDYERPEYQRMRDGSELKNVPIPIWSDQNLSAKYHTQLPRPHHENSPLIESHLSGSSAGMLEGELISHLSLPIENWMLVFRSQVYRAVPSKGLDVIRPNSPFKLDRKDLKIQQSDVKPFLTGEVSHTERRRSEDTDRLYTVQTKYDPMNRNIEDVTTMITFHQTAGGITYTTLQNHLLNRFDLSAQIRMGRAVLLGKIKQPVSQIQIQSRNKTEQPVLQSHTFVRIVLPVIRLNPSMLASPYENKTDEQPPRKPLPPLKIKLQE